MVLKKNSAVDRIDRWYDNARDSQYILLTEPKTTNLHLGSWTSFSNTRQGTCTSPEQYLIPNHTQLMVELKVWKHFCNRIKGTIVCWNIIHLHKFFGNLLSYKMQLSASHDKLGSLITVITMHYDNLVVHSQLFNKTLEPQASFTTLIWPYSQLQ